MITSQAWLVGQHYQKKMRLAGISTTYRDKLYILSSRAGGEKELARRNYSEGLGSITWCRCGQCTEMLISCQGTGVDHMLGDPPIPP